jgi:glutaredoxin
MYMRIIIFCLLLISSRVHAQSVTSDSLHSKAVLILTEKQLDSISANVPVLYTNKGCGRCATAIKYLKDNNINFIEVNLGIPENRNLMYNKAMVFAGKSNISVMFPVIFYGKNVEYGQNVLREQLLKINEWYLKSSGFSGEAEPRKTQ